MRSLVFALWTYVPGSCREPDTCSELGTQWNEAKTFPHGAEALAGDTDSRSHEGTGRGAGTSPRRPA